MRKINITTAILIIVISGCTHSRTTYKDLLVYQESPRLQDSVGTLYSQIIDSLLPFGARNSIDDVSFKMSQSSNYNFKEYSFVFRRFRTRTINTDGFVHINSHSEVEISEADTKPIYVQLMFLFQENPELSKLQARSMLKVNKWKFTTTDIEDIDTLMQSISNVNFTIPEIGPFMLDGVTYRIQVSSGLSHFDVRLSDEQHPLVMWALKMKEKLERYQ